MYPNPLLSADVAYAAMTVCAVIVELIALIE